MIPETPNQKVSRLRSDRVRLEAQRTEVFNRMTRIDQHIAILRTELSELTERYEKLGETLDGIPEQIEATLPLCVKHDKRAASAELIAEFRKTLSKMEKLAKADE